MAILVWIQISRPIFTSSGRHGEYHQGWVVKAECALKGIVNPQKILPIELHQYTISCFRCCHGNTVLLSPYRTRQAGDKQMNMHAKENIRAPI